MSEKRWFRDFPTEIKNGAASDDYLEHRLRLINLDDISADIKEEAIQYIRYIDRFDAEGGTIEVNDLTYTFKLRDTAIKITFDDDMNARNVVHEFDIQDLETSYDAKLITDYIKAVVWSDAPDAALKEIVTMWKDIDSRHVVRGTDIAIRRIMDVPSLMAIALGGVRIEQAKDVDL